MKVDITLSLTPKEASKSELYLPLAAKRLSVKEDRIAHCRIINRNIDARNKNIKVNLTLELHIDEIEKIAPITFEWNDVSKKTEVVIVGSGPAGLFAALRLIELGYRPIILERGKDVSSRKFDIAALNRNEEVNPDSNYCFGEGGAGTYSDGKLYTRSKKRGDYRKSLEIFKYHGADEAILYDAHPHIGTDRLPRIIAAMRETIINSGGKVLFNTRLTDINIKNNRIESAVCSDGSVIDCAALVLAAGHSAHDIYRLLHRRNIYIESKPFAMGVRVEHKQSLIDKIQYHMDSRGDYLPAASYTLVSQVNGRGVYSFCMCPGGFIVPALSSPGECVVNGMSPSGRNSKYANSGIAVQINQSDFAHLEEQYGVLAGLEYQKQLEHLAFENGGGSQIAPGQRLTDFVNSKDSASLPGMSYHPGAVCSDIHKWLPSPIKESLQQGFRDFDKKMRGFLTNEAVVLGVESRTSSSVRIPRDRESFMHTQIDGLFPCGEGAGYAGGIISAAIDGEQTANKLVEWLKNK